MQRVTFLLACADASGAALRQADAADDGRVNSNFQRVTFLLACADASGAAPRQADAADDGRVQAARAVHRGATMQCSVFLVPDP